MPSSNPTPLSGGKQSAGPATSTPPNKLRAATGSRYAPDSPVLHRAQGRTLFTSPPSSGTAYITALNFNSATDQVYMQQGTGAYIAPVGTTGTFSAVNGQVELSTDTATAITLTAASVPVTATRFGDSWIVANGADRPYIVENNLRMRKLGLLPPISAPTISTTTTAVQHEAQSVVTDTGRSSNLANTIDGDSTTLGRLEGSSETQGDPILASQATWSWAGATGVTTSPTGWAIHIDAYAAIGSGWNSVTVLQGNTDWSVVLSYSTDGGTTFTDERYIPATFSRTTLTIPLGSAGTLDVTDVRVRVTLLANIARFRANIDIWRVWIDDGGVTPTSSANAGVRYRITEVQHYSTLPPSFTSPVPITIESEPSEAVPPDAQDAFTFASAHGIKVTFPTTTVNAAATHWRVYRTPDGANQDLTKAIDQYSLVAELPISATSWIDTFGGAGHPLDYLDPLGAIPFLKIGDLVTDSNSPPPGNCDVVGAFKGHALYASSDVPGRWWYSRPTHPDYVPSQYGDSVDGTVTAFVDLGLLLVFTPTSITSYSVLQLANDTSFVQSREGIPVSRRHGCVSRRGVATIQPRGEGLLAAFVSGDGLYYTDGARVWLLSGTLNWPSEVDATALSDCILQDDPEERALRLLFTDSAGVRQELAFYYDHPFERNAPLGPRRVPSGSAAGIRQSTGVFRLYTEQSGSVYLESSGTKDNALLEDATGSITFSVQTGQLYPFKKGEHGVLEEVWVDTDAAAGAQLTVTVVTRIDGKGPSTTTEVLDLDLGGRKPVSIHNEGRDCESFNVTFSTTSENFPGINDWGIVTELGDKVFAGDQA